MGEQHIGERLDMDVQAGPRTKHGLTSEATLAGPPQSRESEALRLESRL